MYTKTKDVMTKKIVAISVDAKLSEAAKIMNENRFRHLPVVDGKQGIVGVISSKDLSNFAEISNMSVEFFMSNPVLHLHEDTPLQQAARKMLENKISCLIVSNQETDAVGIVTTDDLLWHLISKLEQEPENKIVATIEKVFNQETIGHLAHQLSLAGV